MNSFNTFQQFALTQQQQTNITGGNALRPQNMPAVLMSSVNTWSSETNTAVSNTTSENTVSR